VGYSALLGPIAGILICDYFIVQRTSLHLKDLYLKDGRYFFKKGFNVTAVIALTAGIVPNLPGFFGTIGLFQVSDLWIQLYHYAWFVGFAIAFFVYLILNELAKNKKDFLLIR
jgi:NCS1 family nucleobase:cation symporter-1